MALNEDTLGDQKRVLDSLEQGKPPEVCWELNLSALEK